MSTSGETSAASVFAALAEPNRLRIVELLGAAPRPVGEIAIRLGLRQPQVTKHLQTLERAGLVTVHRFGRRRICALRRGSLRSLAAWLLAFDVDHPSEDVLRQYEAAIQAEQVLAAAGESGQPRRLDLSRQLPAAAPRVWEAWTSAEEVRAWWAPTHFEVAECTVEPREGGLLRVVMEEADGARHVSEGRFLRLQPGRELSFELAPLDDAGRPLFQAVHRVRMDPDAASTRLSMTIELRDPTPGATTALAGMQIGWEQLFDKLAAHLVASGAS